MKAEKEILIGKGWGANFEGGTRGDRKQKNEESSGEKDTAIEPTGNCFVLLGGGECWQGQKKGKRKIPCDQGNMQEGKDHMLGKPIKHEGDLGGEAGGGVNRMTVRPGD